MIPYILGGRARVVSICWFSVHCGLYGYVDCESQAHPEGECTILLSLYSEFDVGSEAVEMMVATPNSAGGGESVGSNHA